MPLSTTQNIILVTLILWLQACDTFKPTTTSTITSKPIITNAIVTNKITTTPIVVMNDTIKKITLITLQTNTMDSTNNSPLLVNLLKEHPTFFDSILQHKQAMNVQIIYTQIDRASNGNASLKNYYYNVNSSHYFYPASTIKLPVSILALQKLNELKSYGIDKNTTMLTGAAYSGQTAVYNDPTTFDGRPNVANYIKKILLVSDNDAYNRLYEFLGQQYINEQLHSKGYDSAAIITRLQLALTEDENRHTNPIQFIQANNEILYEQAMQNSTLKYAGRNDFIGKGFYKNDVLINSPMDFSKKNKLCLEDLHIILTSLIFPNSIKAAQRFNITDNDRKFLLKYMSQWPTESTYPPYATDSINYYPAYCKFIFCGASKQPIPNNIRIFNKVGDAYGQVIDAAYFVDFEHKVEFILSAAIYCNADGILNDDKYDYESIGYPFMKNIGQVIYAYELKREKKVLPDLSEFIFEYDKKN